MRVVSVELPGRIMTMGKKCECMSQGYAKEDREELDSVSALRDLQLCNATMTCVSFALSRISLE